MFCPKCGQERISMDTSFCSRCGFLLTGASDLLLTGGLIPQLTSQPGYREPSPRNRGLKQGLFIFLLSFLIVPLLAMFSMATRTEPFAMAIAAILLVAGGLLRAAYALMFESPVPGGKTLEESAIAGVQNLYRQQNAGSLPPQQSIPASTYVQPATGNWRDTNELEPRSVTENTTKLLENEELPQ